MSDFKTPWYMKGMKLHECCVHHCRDWRETKNGKIPASDHSPGCKNYKTIELKEVFFPALGNGWIDYEKNIEPSKLDMEPEDLERMVVKSIFMTEDQFKKLPEFQGF